VGDCAPDPPVTGPSPELVASFAVGEPTAVVWPAPGGQPDPHPQTGRLNVEQLRWTRCATSPTSDRGPRDTPCRVSGTASCPQGFDQADSAAREACVAPGWCAGDVGLVDDYRARVKNRWVDARSRLPATMTSMTCPNGTVALGREGDAIGFSSKPDIVLHSRVLWCVAKS
jgi:hypothetical protein